MLSVDDEAPLPTRSGGRKPLAHAAPRSRPGALRYCVHPCVHALLPPPCGDGMRADAGDARRYVLAAVLCKQPTRCSCTPVCGHPPCRRTAKDGREPMGSFPSLCLGADSPSARAAAANRPLCALSRPEDLAPACLRCDSTVAACTVRLFNLQEIVP
jgi:hypothetical protein